MSDNIIILEKKAAIIDTILLSKGLSSAPTMRVHGALDISGSMDDEINDGSLQKAFDQFMGVAFKFDDNGEIDTWKFNHRTQYIGVAKPADLGKFIRAHGIRAGGSTSYIPIIESVTKETFVTDSPAEIAPAKTGIFGWGKKLVQTLTETVTPGVVIDNTPVYLIILTDGAPDEDISELITAYSKVSHLPLYTQIVGVSNQPGTFRKAEALAKALPNVGFVPLSGFNLSDEQVYNSMITPELVKWLAKFPATPIAASA